MRTGITRAAGFAVGLSALLLAPLSAALAQEKPTLETVATMQQGPGNIAVTPDGTVVVSVHPALSPESVAVAIRDGETSAFPPGAWSTVLDETADDGTPGMRPVLGVRADRNGRVWMLSGGSGQFPKYLYAWDTEQDSLARTYRFGHDQAQPRSFFNDIALAPDHGTVFISDPAGGDDAAIVIVDLESGDVTRRLEGDESVQAEEIAAHINGQMLGFPGENGETTPLRGAVNPITIDAAEEWLYYAPMSGRTVYRVRVDDLLDDTMTEDALSARVESYAEKPASAGITIDDSGTVYITDIQNHAVGATAPDTGYRILVEDAERLSWPDGLSTGPDGYIYVASNSLFKNFPSHSADGPPTPPFYITRFKALGPTTVGR